uniref:Uncharacterized protein n=1 Tax=Plectus sambesii TaxID=2011161 RepID=A0A914WFC1_9BILA
MGLPTDSGPTAAVQLPKSLSLSVGRRAEPHRAALGRIGPHWHWRCTLGACSAGLARPFAYCLPAGGCGALIARSPSASRCRPPSSSSPKSPTICRPLGIRRTHCFGSAVRTVARHPDTHLLLLPPPPTADGPLGRGTDVESSTSVGQVAPSRSPETERRKASDRSGAECFRICGGRSGKLHPEITPASPGHRSDLAAVRQRRRRRRRSLLRPKIGRTWGLALEEFTDLLDIVDSEVSNIEAVSATLVSAVGGCEVLGSCVVRVPLLSFDGSHDKTSPSSASIATRRVSVELLLLRPCRPCHPSPWQQRSDTVTSSCSTHSIVVRNMLPSFPYTVKYGQGWCSNAKVV